MIATAPLARHDEPREEDNIVQLHGVTWADYLHVLRIRGEHSAPRITYLDGTLQIMSPARDHETIKSKIARLFEAWCLDSDVEFTAVGSWTIKKKRFKRGAEPDECYIFGPHDPAATKPHLAIEVEWTSGGIDKLEVYRKLGVREIWYWRRGHLQVYALRRERYVAVARSLLFPKLDLPELARFVDRPTTSGAVREYRAALRRR